MRHQCSATLLSPSPHGAAIAIGEALYPLTYGKRARNGWPTGRIPAPVRWGSFTAEIRIEHFDGALFLPRREAATHGVSLSFHAAVGGGGMNTNRQRDLLHKKTVCLFRMFEGRQKRLRQAAHDPVVDARTSLVVQFVDVRRLRIICDGIQCHARKVKVNGMEWIIDVKHRITLEIILSY